MPAFAEAVAAAAQAEFARFAGRDETDPDAIPLLREYWMAGAGLSAASANRMIADREPWSAAFISFVVLKALTESKSRAVFPQSAGHWQYVGAAIRNDFNGAPRPAFFGIPGTSDGSEPVQVGDIVGTPRTTALDDYEDALRKARKVKPDDQSYFSHFDVVVGIEAGKAQVIGGNVSQSVARRPIRLASDGRLPVRGFTFEEDGDIAQAPFIALVRHLA